jgi:hypothetical protein
MSAHPKEILNEAVHGREALRLGGRLEAPHLALALARRLVVESVWTSPGARSAIHPSTCPRAV